MPKLKRDVLFLIPSLHGGGAERVIVTLTKHLDRSKFCIRLAVVDTRGAAYRDELPADVELIDLRASRTLFALPRIIRLVWQLKPDVLLSTLSHMNLAVAMARPLLPNGIFYIGRESNTLSEALQDYRCSAIWRGLYKIFYRKLDFFICQSTAMQDDLVRNFKVRTTRSIVIHNPVDIDAVKRLAKACVLPSKKEADEVILVAAGRLCKQKGFDLLIDALAQLGSSHVKLKLLGEGPLLDDLRRLADIKGVLSQIEFLGFQKNPYPWFARADAFIISSRYEGLPNVVLEALACGTPVIGTPTGGTREILERIPQCVITKDTSADAIAHALRKWLRGPQTRVPISYLKDYMLESIVEQYSQVLR